MQPTSQTLSADEAMALACASTRVQPYRFIHKALRLMFAQAQQRAGALDARDAAERAELVDELDRLLAFCADHLAHENRFLHAPLRERAPRAVLPFDDDHAQHAAAIDALRLLLQRVRDAAHDTSAGAFAYELYLRLSQFIGENLAHMVEEETTMTRALWSAFTDDELNFHIGRLHASLSPDEHAFALQWMARALNVSELIFLLDGMRAALPAPAFAAAAGMVRGELDARRWARVADALRLGVAGAPWDISRGLQ